jgi:hypothetical protein
VFPVKYELDLYVPYGSHSNGTDFHLFCLATFSVFFGEVNDMGVCSDEYV